MKNFIKNILLFSLFAIVFYIVVMPIWSTLLPPFMSKNVRSCVGCFGHTFTRTQEAKNIKDIDVLIVGSSHAYRGVDPRILKTENINAFNLGSSSQTPINTKVLLYQYLDIIKPKLVVYEAYPGTLETDGVESSLDLLSNNVIDANSVEMAIIINKLSTYNTLIFSGYRQLFGLNKLFKEPTVQSTDTYIHKTGFVESSLSKNMSLKEYKPSNYQMRSNQKEELKNNIDYIKSKNIDVFIIESPITKKLYKAKTNQKEIDQFYNSLSKYKSYQNIVKLNDTADFYDDDHLNQNGVRKFNTILAKDVKKILLEKQQ